MIENSNVKNLKLISIYQVKYDIRIIILLVPIALYYYIFREFLSDLVVGSFIFTYIALFFVFLNQYFKEIIKLPYIHLMKWEYKSRLLCLRPNTIPKNQLNLTHILILEIAPFYCIEAIYIVIFIIFKHIHLAPYFINLVLAILILNMLLVYKNISYLLHVFLYDKNCSYVYTLNTIWIYENV